MLGLNVARLASVLSMACCSVCAGAQVAWDLGLCKPWAVWCLDYKERLLQHSKSCGVLCCTCESTLLAQACVSKRWCCVPACSPTADTSATAAAATAVWVCRCTYMTPCSSPRRAAAAAAAARLTWCHMWTLSCQVGADLQLVAIAAAAMPATRRPSISVMLLVLCLH
jgi:hypothetical protein